MSSNATITHFDPFEVMIVYEDGTMRYLHNVEKQPLTKDELLSKYNIDYESFSEARYFTDVEHPNYSGESEIVEFCSNEDVIDFLLIELGNIPSQG